MTVAPSKGKWWRLVEVSAGSPGRWLTVQFETYETVPYQEDWEDYYANLWEVFEPAMQPGSIFDAYGPWQPGRPWREQTFTTRSTTRKDEGPEVATKGPSKKLRNP